MCEWNAAQYSALDKGAKKCTICIDHFYHLVSTFIIFLQRASEGGSDDQRKVCMLSQIGFQNRETTLCQQEYPGYKPISPPEVSEANTHKVCFTVSFIHKMQR